MLGEPQAAELDEPLFSLGPGAAQARHRTDLLRLGLQSAPKDVIQPESLAPFWQLEPKGPEEGGEHQEELHSG